MGVISFHYITPPGRYGLWPDTAVNHRQSDAENDIGIVMRGFTTQPDATTRRSQGDGVDSAGEHTAGAAFTAPGCA